MQSIINEIKTLLDFIYDSPTPFHLVLNVEERLKEVGFVKVEEGDRWKFKEGDRFYFTRDQSSIVAVVLGEEPIEERGAIIFGAHTDFPSLRIKPVYFYRDESYGLIPVEIYGGPILQTWFDRDLGIAGRVVIKGERGIEERYLKIDDRAVRISTLPIHLNRKVNEEGLKVDRQKDLNLVVTAESDFDKDKFKKLIAEKVGVKPEKILDWDLFLYDLQKGSIGGISREFYYSSRIDNLSSCYAITSAFIDSSNTDSRFTKVMVLFNNEEVGSKSFSGAESNLLVSLLQRLSKNSFENYYRAISKSFIVSVDSAHGFNPIYKDKFDSKTKAYLNHGPVIKINASQRYVSLATTSSLFILACENCNIPYQYYVNNNNIPSGTTIGPIVSKTTGIATVDIGVPIFSMHSIREMAGCKDIVWLIKVLKELYLNYDKLKGGD